MTSRRPSDRTNYQPQQQRTHKGPSYSKEDSFYGHKELSALTTRYITHLFACSEHPPRTAKSPDPPLQATLLPYFIAYAHHRTKLDYNVTYAALVLLQRLKARFPTARGSSGHRLFISAYMISSKVICDDTYSNKSWVTVAQDLFTLREVNQMEREMCGYLEWELTVDYPMLIEFKGLIQKDFKGSGPYPTYSLQLFSKRGEPNTKKSNSTAPSPMLPPNSTTSPIPTFSSQQRQPSPPRIDTSVSTTKYKKAGHNAPLPNGSPDTPKTPGSSYSNTTSPAMSASPQTPEGYINTTAQIVYPSNAKFQIHEGPMLPPLKTELFAHAVPAEW